MNEYTFEQCKVGLKESFEASVTEDMMKRFAEMTGDFNPLHCDEEFANRTSQMHGGGRAVYGMLTASFLSTLAGMYLPGKYSLIHEVETKFLKPVRVGSRLLVSGEVVETNETFSQIVLKVEIRNVTDGAAEKVLRGKMKIGFLQENE